MISSIYQLNIGLWKSSLVGRQNIIPQLFWQIKTYMNILLPVFCALYNYKLNILRVFNRPNKTFHDHVCNLRKESAV